MPSSPDVYVHRIGRTGRAGREGMAITLVEPREHRLLQNIEAATRTRLERATVPTVADLRERRLELLRSSLRVRLAPAAGDGGSAAEGEGNDDGGTAVGLERYRAVVEALADEYDAVEIALAAIALLDAEEARGDAELEIAPATLPQDRPPRPAGRPLPGRPLPGRPGPDRGGIRRPGPRPSPRPSPPVSARLDPARPAAARGCASSSAAGVAPGSGRPTWSGPSRPRPGVPGSVIGAIQITDSFSLVDIAGDVVDVVIRALRGATIRGRTFAVRLDRDMR